jgi:hypothetical protein
MLKIIALRSKTSHPHSSMGAYQLGLRKGTPPYIGQSIVGCFRRRQGGDIDPEQEGPR